MPRFIHIVPYDGIGGVESAVRSMPSISSNKNINFSIDFIFKNIANQKQRWSTFNPVPIFSAAWRASRSDVDFVIISLWRSAIVALLAKLLRPKLKLITFLHNSRDEHIFDFVFTRLAVWLSIEVWADSQSTLIDRITGIHRKKCQIISFVTRHFEVLQSKKVEPCFIFWGRINQQKGIERAIRIFADIQKTNPQARFLIIGPDGGLLNAMQELCTTLGLSNTVEFLGAMTHDDIIRHASHASFYLQTSLYEGMAMSVVESMQLGLVPIVTAVGEISTYCKHDNNAVIVESDENAVADILYLLNSNDKYQALRSNAVKTWKNHPLYRESVMNACESHLPRL